MQCVRGGYFLVGFVAVHDGFPMVIHVICAALHQIAVVGKCGIQQGVNGTGQKKIIGINKHNVFAENFQNPGISRAGMSLVPLVNDCHPRVVGVGVRDRGGGVGRAVVHQNDFKIREGLGKDGRDAAGDTLAARQAEAARRVLIFLSSL